MKKQNNEVSDDLEALSLAAINLINAAVDDDDILFDESLDRLVKLTAYNINKYGFFQGRN